MLNQILPRNTMRKRRTTVRRTYMLILGLIIQQTVTMPIHGNEALSDRYPAIYVDDHIWKCTADFLSWLVWQPF